MRRALSLMTACAMAWLSFYLLGSLLLKIPPGFHDGGSWRPLRVDER